VAIEGAVVRVLSIAPGLSSYSPALRARREGRAVCVRAGLDGSMTGRRRRLLGFLSGGGGRTCSAVVAVVLLKPGGSSVAGGG
jgi:hypothetical protein